MNIYNIYIFNMNMCMCIYVIYVDIYTKLPKFGK